MSELHGEYNLPRVDDVDLARIWPEDITDPTHAQRWERFAANNPIIAREVLERARILSCDAHDEHSIAARAINLVTFAAEALETAGEREKAEKKFDVNDGDGDEVPPLSA